MKNLMRVGRNLLGILFKLSILPGVFYLSPTLIDNQNINPTTTIIGSILILFGLTGMMISDLLILRFGDGRLHFSASNTRLVNVGFYARTRHPFSWFFSFYQYGVLLIFLGFNWIVLILSISTSLLILSSFPFIQEKLLINALGQKYVNYQQSTPLWYWKRNIPENLQVGLRPQLVWIFGMLVLRFWYRLELKGSENTPHDRPFLVVANHECYLDPFLFGIFLPFEVKFVTTADVFTTPLMRFLLKGTGSFPMHRHRQDLKSIRTMIRMVNSGQVVCIFPEGGRSIDGSPLPILKETLKLIQKCRVPILPIHLDGAYEIWPRWAPNRRHGKVTATFGAMIPVENQTDLGALETQIKNGIFPSQKIFRPVKSKRITGGIDSLLWACYKCNSRNSIQILSGDLVRCTQCGSNWKMSQDYTLTDQQTSDSLTTIEWISKIDAQVLDFPLESDPYLPLENEETLLLTSQITKYINDHGDKEDQQLRLLLTQNRIVLLKQNEFFQAWHIDNITIFTMDYFNAVSIGVGGIRHTFTLSQDEISLKWQTYFDMLKRERPK